MTQPCAIFDADDTLWKTQELFDAAIDRFEHVMYCQGFNPREAHEAMMEINVTLAQQYGARANNFSDAMVETYDRFCQGLGTYYSREVARQLRTIGMIPYTSPVELYDGVRETLETLRERGYSLILCTAGDTSTQLAKLVRSGLNDYFARVYVVP
ncbi:MAG: HAD family hydrolase, partial [Ktedonobacterales bacterium]